MLETGCDTVSYALPQFSWHKPSVQNDPMCVLRPSCTIFDAEIVLISIECCIVSLSVAIFA